MGRFLISFRHKGAEYSLTLPADSLEDAEQRLRAIGAGVVIGSNVTEIPVNSFTLPFARTLARFLVWWRNL